jgi:tRNA (Thr-GGU) A37 N-methylase
MLRVFFFDHKNEALGVADVMLDMLTFAEAQFQRDLAETKVTLIRVERLIRDRRIAASTVDALHGPVADMKNQLRDASGSLHQAAEYADSRVRSLRSEQPSAD